MHMHSVMYLTCDYIYIQRKIISSWLFDNYSEADASKLLGTFGGKVPLYNIIVSNKQMALFVTWLKWKNVVLENDKRLCVLVSMLG